MRLAFIYHVWDDWELLNHSVNHHILSGCAGPDDLTIVIYSENSNFGEYSKPRNNNFTHGFQCEPDLNLRPVDNERNKRNFGLQKARELGCTHFLSLDADEMYDPAEFKADKDRFKNENLLGLVARVKTYFKLPTLTIGYDVTLVPTIHKITPDLKFQWNTRYPFAFDGPKKEIRIDPTRQMNIFNGVEITPTTMHHYSYIRPDINVKIRNSTARANLNAGQVVEDFTLAKPGYFVRLYGKHLEPCSDLFSLCSLPFIQKQERESKTSSSASPPAPDK